MNSFSFGRPVEIMGEIYYIDSDLKKHGEIIASTREALKNADDKDEETINEICQGAIDALLGKGAFNKIFSGRRFLVIDIVDLLRFLTSEISQWMEEENSK